MDFIASHSDTAYSTYKVDHTNSRAEQRRRAIVYNVDEQPRRRQWEREKVVYLLWLIQADRRTQLMLSRSFATRRRSCCPRGMCCEYRSVAIYQTPQQQQQRQQQQAASRCISVRGPWNCRIARQRRPDANNAVVYRQIVAVLAPGMLSVYGQRLCRRAAFALV